MIKVSVKFRVKDFPKISGLKLKGERTVKDYYYDTANYEFLKSGAVIANLSSNIPNKNYIEFFLTLSYSQSKLVKGTKFFYRLFKTKTSEVEKIFKVLKIPFSAKYEDFNGFLKANNLKILVGLARKEQEYEISKNTALYLRDIDDIKKFVEVESEIEDDADVDAEKQRLINKVKALNILEPTDEYTVSDYLDIYLKEFNIFAYNQRKFI